MLYQKDFVICPWCDKQSGKGVSHLYDIAPHDFGPWYCDACGKGFNGRVNARGDVTILRIDAARKFTRSLVLLKLDATDGPVYFIMDHNRYSDKSGETYEEAANHLEYFFESHSCPANWVSECVAIIKNDDMDPHGYLTFVRFVDVDGEFDTDEDENWPLVFPEIFSAPLLEAHAEVVELNRIEQNKKDQSQD